MLTYLGFLIGFNLSKFILSYIFYHVSAFEQIFIWIHGVLYMSNVLLFIKVCVRLTLNVPF